MKKIISVILSSVLIFCISLTAFAAEKNDLKFDSNGNFKILHLTDTQDDHNPAYDMMNLLRKSVEESKPDIIVITGDIVEDSRIGDIGIDDEWGREGVTVKNIKGEIDKEKTLINVKKAVDAIFSVLEEYEIPYVIAQGNNDHKCGIDNADWLEIYSKYPHCIVTDESDDANGRIDRNILIKGADGKPAFNLWIMDSGKGGVNDDQLVWYKNKSEELKNDNNGNVIPAMVFQHIHVDDIGNLFEKCNSWDEGATANGTQFYRLNKNIAVGKNFYSYVPGQSTSEFRAWKEAGDVIGAFFGHQHVDGFSGKYDGIELGFTYGMEFAKPGPYGYRVITLHEDDIFNYDNDLYVYEGSVKFGNDKISLLKDKPYDEYDNVFIAFVMGVINFYKNIFTMVTSLFA